MSETLPAVPAQAGDGILKLANALTLAQAKVRGVEHDRRNEFHKYDYTSAEAIIGAAKVLSEAGLSLIPIEQSLNGFEKEGEHRFELQRKFILLHQSGERFPITINWPVCPEKGRPLDKAVASAATTSLSYFLRDLLLIPRVNHEDDLAARDDTPKQQPAPAKPKADPSEPCGEKWAARLLELATAKGVNLRQLAEAHISKFAQIEMLTKAQAKQIAESLKAMPDKVPTTNLGYQTVLNRYRQNPPTTGQELEEYVSVWDAKLCEEGAINRGAMLKHIQDAAKRENLPAAWKTWNEEAVAMGVKLAREFAVLATT